LWCAIISPPACTTLRPISEQSNSLSLQTTRSKINPFESSTPNLFVQAFFPCLYWTHLLFVRGLATARAANHLEALIQKLHPTLFSHASPSHTRYSLSQRLNVLSTHSLKSDFSTSPYLPLITTNHQKSFLIFILHSLR